jgi:hypothetical protein
MSYLVVRNEDNALVDGPFDEAPDVLPEGTRSVLAPLNYPDVMEWSPALGGFVSRIAPLMSVGRFKLLFTRGERIAMREAATSDDDVADWLDLLNGFTDGVSLSEPMLIGAITEMRDAGLLTQERAAAVLAGEPPEA